MQRRAAEGEAVWHGPARWVWTVEEFLFKMHFDHGDHQDENGWFPVHHAIQETLKDPGLLDVVLTLALGMSPEAFAP